LCSDNRESRTAWHDSISAQRLHQVCAAVRKTQSIRTAIRLDATTNGVADFQRGQAFVNELDNYWGGAAVAEGGRPQPRNLTIENRHAAQRRSGPGS
jgi:hypothetical protein